MSLSPIDVCASCRHTRYNHNGARGQCTAFVSRGRNILECGCPRFHESEKQNGDMPVSEEFIGIGVLLAVFLILILSIRGRKVDAK